MVRVIADVRLRYMRRRWWKAYFVFALLLTIGAFALPFVVKGGAEMPWWHWVYVPLYIAQLVGLFGFVFWRRIGVPPLWKLVFLGSVAYTASNLLSMATLPGIASTEHGGFLIAGVVANLVLQVPMLIGLFLYGFRCKELWHGAT
jgi:hypothetical protein